MSEIIYFKDDFWFLLPAKIGGEAISWANASWELELSTAGNNIYKASHTSKGDKNVSITTDGSAKIEVKSHKLEVGELWCLLKLFTNEGTKRHIFSSGIYLSAEQPAEQEEPITLLIDDRNAVDLTAVTADVEYTSQEGVIEVPTDLQPINFRRSFSFTIYLKIGNTILDASTANWRAIFTTTGTNYYECYKKNDKLKNCSINEDGSIRVLVEHHDLEVGALWCEIGIIESLEDFEEGRRDNTVRVPTGLELVSGYDDIGVDLDLDIVMPYVYVDAYDLAKNAGFVGTREDYIDSLVNLKNYIDAGNIGGGSGGGNTGGGFDASSMWEELRKKATNSNQVIHESHLPDDLLKKSDLMWKTIRE